MSGSPKCYRSGDVIFITTSVEKGLMFPPNALIRILLLSCLARAQEKYYLEICHIIVEATHVHLIAVVHSPADVAQFMRYFKAESAHALNRLLGWSKNTVWCEGYDSPVLLLPEDVQQKITYLYSQPSKDSLAESIEAYQGLSSWKAFLKAQKELSIEGFEAVCVARDDYPYIGHLKKLTKEQYQVLAKKISKNKPKAFLEINPNAWRKAFPYLSDEKVAQINQDAIHILKEEEAQHSATRVREGRTIISAREQVETVIGAAYKPKRTGRRMRCHCFNKEVRKKFLDYTSWLLKRAKEIYESWKVGDYSQPYPAGLFAPSRPRTVEPIVPILSEIPLYS